MEVADKCSDAGEVVSIEIRGGRAPFCWNGGMELGTKIEAPELGTSGISPDTEDNSVVLGKDSDVCFFEEDASVLVTQFADTHQVVMEVRHYVTALYGDSGIIRSQDSEETCGGAPAVMTTTWQSEGLTLA